MTSPEVSASVSADIDGVGLLALQPLLLGFTVTNRLVTLPKRGEIPLSYLKLESVPCLLSTLNGFFW
jgi:hypothetical protein